MGPISPGLRRCTFVTADDIQALGEFLRSSGKTEGQLHRLLEQHTGILAALGYSSFLSEYPVYKRDESDVLRDARRRDRIDILGVNESTVLDQNEPPYRWPSVIELKGAHLCVVQRSAGLRLSDAARDALEQLRNYAEWLTTVEENRRALNQFGLSVLRPGKYLIMGSETEFAGRPGLLAALREDIIQTYRAHLLLLEDVLRQADRARALQYVTMEGVINLRAPAISVEPLILASSGLAGLVMLARNTLENRRTAYGNIVLKNGLSEGLIHIPGPRLQPLARRVGIPFAEAVVSFAQQGRFWKAQTDGIVVAITDTSAIQEAIREREARNPPEIRARRHKARARKEQEYTRTFAEQIRLRFPGLPEGEELKIASRATRVGSGRVGRSRQIDVDDAVVLAVGAHVRWNYTRYPEVLDQIHQEYREMPSSERRYCPPPAEVAKEEVRAEVLRIMERWSQPANG